ncbi:MAG: hypothetical protein WCV82_00610 [Candidatus Paceibacterota bacterium]
MALKDLIQNTNSTEKDLENILKSRVKLLKINDLYSVHIERSFSKTLDQKNKILFYLAGKLAWQILEKNQIWVKPKELESELGISGGTIRPSLLAFKKHKFVEYNKKDKGYRLTGVGLSELIKFQEELE